MQESRTIENVELSNPELSSLRKDDNIENSLTNLILQEFVGSKKSINRYTVSNLRIKQLHITLNNNVLNRIRNNILVFYLTRT